mmetsp:Transcript_104689/g.207993  ORF Transcript_104689/g.207993 Transcript_104689/m.207993 type:complete len:566 (+) Transcript_104689:113-1810(+)
MDSVRAIHLAANVLRDHFGDVVERVGLVMLERGPLSVQDVLRFGGIPSCAGTDSMLIEPLTFQQVRNALLTLVQHGVVRTKPRVEVANSDSVRSMLQVYTIDIEEVFARMRFPHFLEYVRATYGDVAQELLFTALKYGRVTANIIKTEAREALGNVSVEEVEEELKRLLDDRVLHVVAPFGSAVGGPVAVTACSTGPVTSAVPSSHARLPQSGGSAPSSAAAEPAQSGKRKLADDDQQLAAWDPGDAPRRIRESVYRYDMGTLNLCMCKSLICRVVEERVNGHAAQVLTSILTAVQPGESSAENRGVSVQYMSFEAVEQKMRDLGHHQPGRDPEREREKLRKVLDLLSAHKDSLVSRRHVAGPTSNFKAAEKGSSGSTADAVRRVVDGGPQCEWAVDWHGARRLLLSSTTSQLIRDQFGPFGLRIFNLLNERNPPQKLEEKDIFNICMVPPEEGRAVLNAMVQSCVVSWQEVPRSANTPLSASYWLYYVDRRRVELTMLQSVLQAALNLRLRFAAESAVVEPLESRRDSLSARERAALNEGRRIEDTLERSFLILDAAVLVFRSF